MSDHPYATPNLSSSGNRSADGQLSGVRTSKRYEVLALLTLAAAIAYVARNAVGVAESSIREDLGLSLRQSGWFMGTFF